MADMSSGTEETRDGLNEPQLKRATRTRKIFALTTSFFLLIAFIFLILVEIGNTKVGRFYSNVYFLRLNLSQIVPQSVPNANLVNTIAQTLGLHDYYQFGLWNFCEGYVEQGITDCSKPQTLYWFNPVSILLNQLLAGATIALPTEVTTYLHILKIASQVMFGLFLTAACLSFVLIFLAPIVIYSRWWSLPISILLLLSTLCTIIASAIGTAISVIFKRAATSYQDLNIQANVGKEMFAFMWIASAFSLLALLFHVGMSCFCASRRDVKTSRRSGSKKAYVNNGNGVANVSEKPRRNLFGR